MSGRWFFIFGLTLICSHLNLALAAEPIPDCRYDNSLIPIVQQTVDWTIADFGDFGVKLPFDKIVYNQSIDRGDNTLSIQIVKDATLNTVDRSGCILNKTFAVNDSSIAADGRCIATDLTQCSQPDKIYMQRRLYEIHGGFSDVQTGYEMTGACYMTNMQACLHRDRLDLLEMLGPRDKLSVKGGCITHAKPPMSIRCSAGSLKMMLPREAAEELAPSVGILFMIAHEFGHLSENLSSSYDTSDFEIQRDWPREDKFAVIKNQCRLGNALRGKEVAADQLALRVTRQHVAQISERWPKQGTVAWLITQAGHYSTNLVRWHNDWREGEIADVPDEFRPRSGVIRLNDEDMTYLGKEEVPSGFTPLQIRLRSKRFICELAQNKPGRWMILIQSGTTHGTMIERISWLLGNLRRSVASEDDEISAFEDMAGQTSDMVMRQRRSYLNELEAEICDLVEQKVLCPGDISQ